MKKIVLIILIAITFVLLCKYENTYQRKAVVIGNHRGIVDAMDVNGKIWQFNSQKTYQAGQSLVLIMDAHHTNSTADDSIIMVKE